MSNLLELLLGVLVDVAERLAIELPDVVVGLCLNLLRGVGDLILGHVNDRALDRHAAVLQSSGELRLEGLHVAVSHGAREQLRVELFLVGTVLVRHAGGGHHGRAVTGGLDRRLLHRRRRAIGGERLEAVVAGGAGQADGIASSIA